MEIGSTSAWALTNNPTTPNVLGQGGASSAATSSSSASSSGSTQDAAVLQAISSAYASLADSSSSLATLGGLDSSSASTLFSGGSASGLLGFSPSAINLSASLALAAYANQQSGIPNGTLGAAVTGATSNLASTQSSIVQAAIQSAQSTVLTSSLNLLG
jgi:hypothetical protein